MEDKKENKSAAGSGDDIYAILSYLWILCLIPVLMKKDNEFVKFHARQGLVLFIIEIAVFIIGIIPLLGTLVYMLGMFVCGIISVIGIIQVLLGNKWEIPVIHEWSKSFNI